MGVAIVVILFFAFLVWNRRARIRNKAKIEAKAAYQVFEKEKRRNAPPPRAEKKCPACAELILVEATKCRFCGTDVAATEAGT